MNSMSSEEEKKLNDSDESYDNKKKKNENEPQLKNASGSGNAEVETQKHHKKEKEEKKKKSHKKEKHKAKINNNNNNNIDSDMKSEKKKILFQPDVHQRNIVIMGGGHSNVQVLAGLARARAKQFPHHICPDNQKPIEYRIILISNYPQAYYSGMIPGTVARIYTERQCWMDLPAICKWASAEWLQGTVVGVDPVSKMIFLQDETCVPFHILSVDIGSTTLGQELPGVLEHTVATRPISELVGKLDAFEKRYEEEKKNQEHLRITVVGAGGAGIELCWTIKQRFKTKNPQITLINSGEAEFVEYGPSVSKAVANKLKSLKIEVKRRTRVEKIDSENVHLSDQSTIPYDLCIWATGAAPHSCMKNFGLEQSEKGWFLVDDNLRMKSSPWIFGGGDCIDFINQSYKYVTKAGVFAVREGPFILENILHLIRQHPTLDSDEEAKKAQLTPYVPQKGFLALFCSGDGGAIGHKSGWCLNGGWVMRLKDYIDVKFMNNFEVKNMGPPPK